MKISYNKLWKILIDKNLKKKDLCRLTKISDATMAKLGKSENVNTEILLRICNVLECDISDIMEIKKGEK
ncbi:MAG: helix-turn-helix transcriptional regulator [Candidatus Gracilibacteria bacterium]|nr:helix-turn-helix transcriptional regulator [Candidatus Gracilibacteria bacterium]